MLNDMKKHWRKPKAFPSVFICNSPAAAAGLKSGDIITQFNGKTIKDMDSLLNAMDSSDIGKKVDLTVVRDNKDKIKLQLTVADKNS